MTSASAWENVSALGGTRTPNLLIRSQVERVRACPAESSRVAFPQPGYPSQVTVPSARPVPSGRVCDINPSRGAPCQVLTAQPFPA